MSGIKAGSLNTEAAFRRQALPAAGELVERIIPTADAEQGAKTFDIRAADSLPSRGLACELVSRMYARRGYQTSSNPAPAHPLHRTFVVKEGLEVVGTLTINVGADDNPLKVEDCFASEVKAIKDQGLGICEYTRLAMSSQAQSPRVLAALFHVAHIFAFQKKGLDRLLIEVNPRHVRYYRSMLGFEVIGAPRHNPRVNAPAVLLSLDLHFAQKQIDGHWNGVPPLGGARSAYPFSFSPEEQQGIAKRLDAMDNSVATVSDVCMSPVLQARADVQFMHLH